MHASKLSILISLGAALLFGQDTGKLGIISGRVVNSVTGEGIRRAEVVVRARTAAGRGIRPEPAPLTVATDAEGAFKFDGVEAGDYFLNVEKQGFVAERRTAFAGRVVRVASGQDVGGLEYKLQPQTVITGRVVDDEGEPVRDISVAVMQRRFLNGKRRWAEFQHGTTNDLGEFRIFNLPPGKVIVSAKPVRRAVPTVGSLAASLPAGRNEQQYFQTFHPNALEAGQATVIETSAGQTVSNVDIQLQRVAVYRIRGRVVDREAQGPMEFGVSAVRVDDMTHGNAGARAKRDGTFEIRGVRPGIYNVTATTYERLPAVTQRKMGVARVDVSGDVEDLTIEIKGGFKVSGTLSIQSATSGAKSDPKSAILMLVAVEPGMYYGPPAQVVVAADGTWTAENVVPGVYRLEAILRTAEGASAYIAAVTAGGLDSVGRELDMTQGPPGPIRVVLSTDSGTIKATLDAGEPPGEGEWCVVIPLDPRSRLVDKIKAAPAEEDGSFTIGGLRPGEYLVAVFDGFLDGALADPEIFKQVEGKGMRVKVAAGQTTTEQVKLTPLPAEATGQ